MRRLLIGLILLIGLSATAEAETNSPTSTFIVTSTADNPAADSTSDKVCKSTAADGACTLRAAIEEANGVGGVDVITFAIAGNGPHNIMPSSALPTISEGVEILGDQQPGASCPAGAMPADLRIVLDGTSAPDGSAGLTLDESADNSLMRGLTIINFDREGILLSGADQVAIECNHLGVAANGKDAAGNHAGIMINGSSSKITVGGSTDNSHSERNVISGNLWGIDSRNGAQDITVSGNFVGVDATGLVPLGNQVTGVSVRGSDWVVGGNQPYHTNVISDNRSGIQINNEASNIAVDFNFIGVNAEGSDNLGNDESGISIGAVVVGQDYLNIRIGETAGNIIANSSLFAGISVNDFVGVPKGVTVRKNSIYNNGGLGIDLGSDGVTANDADDADNGANDLQNWPVLVSAETDGSFSGSLQKPASFASIYQIDFYLNDSCDPSGNGEGKAYIGTHSFTAPFDNNPSFDAQFDPVPAGKFITATATETFTGSTSEFSNCIAVDDVTFKVNSTANSADANPGDGRCASLLGPTICTLEAAVQEVNAFETGRPIIEFDFVGGGVQRFTPNTRLILESPATIDGTTYDDSSCPTFGVPANLNIEIDGSSLPSFSYVLTLDEGSDGSAIRGLAMFAGPSSGLSIESNSNVVTCSLFGLEADGTPNGNGGSGIRIFGGDNNHIGTVDSYADRNVVADNDSNGISIGNSSMHTIISGNFIGTDPSGTVAVPNEIGVFVNQSQHTTIGGAGARQVNWISGNSSDGIRVFSSSNITVTSNTIGLFRDTATGGNGNRGIYLNNVTSAVLGEANGPGTSNGMGNVIIGSGGHGVYMLDSLDISIRNNTIRDGGFDNPAQGTDGIHIRRSYFVGIGGALAGQDNTITNNAGSGIQLQQGIANVLIQGNSIGKFGAPAGNGTDGILITDTVTSVNVISNTISGNGRDGIRVDSTSAENSFIGNFIYNNAATSIDLNGDGATTNDPAPDADSGGNGLTNYPTMTSAAANTGVLLADLNAKPNTNYIIEFFAASDNSRSESWSLLAQVDVTTDAAGFAAVSANALGAFPQSSLISATATDWQGDGTSEISPSIEAVAGSPTMVAVSSQLSNSSSRTILVAAIWLLLLLLTLAQRALLRNRACARQNAQDW